MSAEAPKQDHYLEVIHESENHTVLSLQGELPVSDATIQLVLVAISAFDAGLSQDEIVTALIEGEARGVTLYSNLSAVNDLNYWKAVRAEAEAFWAERYNRDSLE